MAKDARSSEHDAWRAFLAATPARFNTSAEATTWWRDVLSLSEKHPTARDHDLWALAQEFKKGLLDLRVFRGRVDSLFRQSESTMTVQAQAQTEAFTDTMRGFLGWLAGVMKATKTWEAKGLPEDGEAMVLALRKSIRDFVDKEVQAKESVGASPLDRLKYLAELTRTVRSDEFEDLQETLREDLWDLPQKMLGKFQKVRKTPVTHAMSDADVHALLQKEAQELLDVTEGLTRHVKLRILPLADALQARGSATVKESSAKYLYGHLKDVLKHFETFMEDVHAHAPAVKESFERNLEVRFTRKARYTPEKLRAEDRDFDRQHADDPANKRPDAPYEAAMAKLLGALGDEDRVLKGYEGKLKAEHKGNKVSVLVTFTGPKAMQLDKDEALLEKALYAIEDRLTDAVQVFDADSTEDPEWAEGILYDEAEWQVEVL